MSANYTWYNSCHHPNAKALQLNAPHIIDLAMDLHGGQELIHTYKHFLHFGSYNVVENKASFVLECPVCNSSNYRFPSPYHDVALDSLKSFYQLDHHNNFNH